MNERKRKQQRMENEIGLMFSPFPNVLYHHFDAGWLRSNERNEKKTSTYDFLADFQVLCIGIRAAMLSSWIITFWLSCHIYSLIPDSHLAVRTMRWGLLYCTIQSVCVYMCFGALHFLWLRQLMAGITGKRMKRQTITTTKWSHAEIIYIV